MSDGLLPGFEPVGRPTGPPAYVFGWGNNPRRAELKGRRCRILARGARGSVLVAFEGGAVEVVSRRALRRA